MQRLLVLAVLTLGACSATSGRPDPVAEFEKLAQIRLGSEYENVIAEVGPSYFSDYSVAACLEEMALRGCPLLPTDKYGSFVTVGGVPLTLEAEFAPNGNLSAATLEFIRGDEIDPVTPPPQRAECERTVAAVRARAEQLFGPTDVEPPTKQSTNEHFSSWSISGRGTVGLWSYYMSNLPRAHCMIRLTARVRDVSAVR